MITDSLKDKKRIIIWILAAAAFIAAAFVYINFEDLRYLPFESGIAFDEPEFATMNSDGYKAVIDSYGSRVLVISPDNKFKAEIKYSALSSVSPKSASYLAMDAEKIYILDQIKNPDGMSAGDERILIYDLDGKCKGVIFDTETDAGSDMFRVVSVACDNGRVYATGYYEDDDMSVVVADVTDGTVSELHHYSCTAGLPFEYIYQPQQDMTAVITCDGSICSFRGDEALPVYKPDGHVDKILYMDNGDVAVLDVNADTIAVYDSGEETEDRALLYESPRFIIDTDAESFDICGDSLIYADPNAYMVCMCDTNDEHMEGLEGVPYTSGTRTGRWLTWAAFIIGAAALIALIGILAAGRIKRKREEEETGLQKRSNPLTTGRLYGPNFLIMLIVFAVTSLLLGRLYYSSMIEKTRSEVYETAYRISRTSREGFGDDLVAVKSQEDYKTEEYAAICDHIDNICKGDEQLHNKTAMTCDLYRFMEGSDTVMVVTDSSDYNRIGTLFDDEDQERKLLTENIEYAREGRFSSAEDLYESGTELYSIYAPVYDSRERIVGVTAVMCNETGIKSEILSALASRLQEIFTLLAGLCILMAEVSYARMAAKIKKAQLRSGVKNSTVIEADRTVNIFVRIPNGVFMTFYALMVSGVLSRNGTENSTFLLALAVTLQGAVYAFVKMIGPSIARKDPKAYLYVSLTIGIVGFIMCMIACSINDYMLIAAGGCVASISGALGLVSGKRIKQCGKKPEAEYSLMVFSRVETTIASAIGAALGAVARSIYGDTGLMILAIVMSLVTYPVINYFVGDDTRAPRNNKNAGKLYIGAVTAVLKRDADVFRKPKMIAATLLSLLPLGFLSLFSSYVLPLLNEYEGLPDVVIGIITLVIQLLVLFVIPHIVKWIARLKLSNIHILAVGMGAVAVFLLIFGMDGTMRTLVVVLFAVAILKLCIPRASDGVFDEEAGEAGVLARNTVSELCEGAGGYLGPMLLSFMMLSGPGSLGYWWFMICAVCAVAIMIISGFRLTGIKNGSPGPDENESLTPGITDPKPAK